jgi:hypothetical protein
VLKWNSPSQSPRVAYNKPERQKIRIHDKRARNIDRLRNVLGIYDWSFTTDHSCIDEVYNDFLDVVATQISFCIPSKVVSIGPRDPSFTSPLIKCLLVKRNRLRRKGRVEEPNLLADQINILIAESRNSQIF